MKLFFVVLFASVYASVEETGQHIIYVIQAEMILFPLIVISLALLYLNYNEIILSLRAFYITQEKPFELKPFIKPTEPEMEP